MTGGVYFPVDAAFCETQAARQVRHRYGYHGFYAYVCLMCALLAEDGGRMALASDDDWTDLADRLGYGEDVATVRELVAVLDHYGAVVTESGVVFSPLVSSGIVAREETVRRAKAGAAARWDKGKAKGKTSPDA